MGNQIFNDALCCDGLTGTIKHTKSVIRTVNIILDLDKQTGLYLCDALDKEKVIKCPYLDREQHEGLINLGLMIAPHFGHRISEAENRSVRVGVGGTVTVSILTVELHRDVAWSLSSLLSAALINEVDEYPAAQKKALIHLGAAIGAFHGHSSAMLKVKGE